MEVQPTRVHMEQHSNVPVQSPIAYVQRNAAAVRSNVRNTPQMDVSHVYLQTRPHPSPPVSGILTHSRPVYPSTSYQPSPVQHRFQAATVDYVPYRDPQVSIGNHDGQQPFKKLRILESKSDVQQPLRIDVRESSTAYTPLVEAISPTFPNETNEDPVRTTKEDLLQQINKVDREIAQIEQKISQLKAQEAELEANALHPEEKRAADEKIEPNTAKSQHQSLAQKIYTENRRKAAESHRSLSHLGPPIDVPLYNQPSDTAIYHINARRHAAFKGRLIIHLKRKAAEKREYERRMTATYNELMAKWLKELEKFEKKRAKDAPKYREDFEKVFPELRKQREDKERFNRVGARAKSEADVEEILENLNEQELEEKKMRSYAVVPPMLLDPVTRRYRYKNTNGRIEDMARTYKDSEFVNYWNTQEHDVFKEKYLQHPKNFTVIASYLEKKSVSNCVIHYYFTKKHENYKQLLRKTRQGRNRSGRGQPASKVPAIAQQEAPSGVTTRLQREQLQKQEPGTSTGTAAVPEPTASSSAAVETPTTSSSATVTTTPMQPEPSTSAMEVEMDLTSETSKKRRKGNKAVDNNMESSDDEVQIPPDQPGPHTCAVCKTLIEPPGHSRPLPPDHASQYGLSESDIAPGARVCNSCRCRAVRSRRLVCPLPTCPNIKSFVQRLRSMPIKWSEVLSESAEAVIRDFQIPNGTTKCCSTCFARISRRLAPTAASVEEDATRWPEQDIETLRNVLKEHGPKWPLVAERLPGRTQQQCKSFYFNYRKKFKLDAIVHEYYKAKFGDDRKPTVTDEEESGSSTSSCDEQPPRGMDTSDTASAGSPAKQSESSMPTLSKDGASPCLEASTDPYYERTTNLPVIENEGRVGDSVIYAKLPGTSISAIPGPPSLSPSQTVQDLMANVIEKQLMKSPGGVAVSCSGPPTISSILGSDSSSFKRGIGGSLATLSVVGKNNEPDLQKEQKPNVVVLSVTSQSDRDSETLDLSMKKREVSAESISNFEQQQQHRFALSPHSKNIAQVYQRDQHYYQQQASEQSKLQTPHLVMSHTRGPPAKGPPPGMPKLSPKPPASIQVKRPVEVVHSAPMQISPRFDPKRQLPQSQHKEGGSITQGTPVQHHAPGPDKRQIMAYDYYPQQRPPPTTSSASFNSPYPTARQPTSYPLEQQLSSRQIIMSDYITSQQMHGSRRVSVSTSDKPDSRQITQLYYNSPPSNVYYPRFPAETVSTPPLRQGVIQRHNTVPTAQGPSRGHSQQQTSKVHYLPPGHEAFSSLVEAAVQQPSLPVPSNEKKQQYREHHEGLLKQAVDSGPSPRMMDHGRMSSTAMAEQQLRMRQQERDRMMAQREQGQRYQQAAREQSDSHHQQQVQMQMRQQQIRLEQQSRIEQQSRMEQQARMEERMESSRLQQSGQARLDFEAKQQFAAYMDAEQRAEREKEWERSDQNRHLIAAAYGRERHIPPQRISYSAAPSRPTSSTTSSRPGNDTMTAASLIDAIITHQINQTSEGRQAPQTSSAPTRPGDRLFQGFPPPHSEPVKPSESHPSERVPVKSISEHIDNIIAKDYPTSSYTQHHKHHQDEQQAWKMSCPVNKPQQEEPKPDERQIIRMAQPQPTASKYHEPVSPPDQWPGAGARCYEKPSHLSPLDYVKSRIVEVMRTSEDKEGEEKPKEPGSPSEAQTGEERKPPPESTQPTSGAYTYPYSSIGAHVSVSRAETPSKGPAE